MRLGVYALLAVSACGGSVFAQTPAPPASAPGQPDATPTPLTPIEERDKQVREFDPLDRDDKDGKSDRSKSDRETSAGQAGIQAPIPGSIAASEQSAAARRAGPAVIEDGESGAPVQEYSGPAVLSRSYSVNQPLIPEQVKWQEALGLNSIYDTGITRQVGADGVAGAPITLIGAQATWRVEGRHYFRRDMFSVSYSGNYQKYTTNDAYNGTNQALALEYSHVLSRRLTLNLSGTGTILSENYSLENQAIGPGSVANVDLGSSPSIQIYDLGSKQFNTRADLTWQKSSRLSFSVGTSYFGIFQDSAALLGVKGTQARGDVDYRLTRKTTVGTYYSFNHYLYSQGIGNSDTNTAGLIYSYAFNRTTQIRFRGGLSRVASIGLQPVQIDPTIAALLGQSTGIIDARSTFRTSDFSAQFVKDFRRGSTLSLSYARGIAPGNGVFQTSQQESISATYATRIFRVYAFQTAIGRDSLSAVAQALSKYESVYGRIGLSRDYRRGIGVNLMLEYRYFDLGTLGFVRDQMRIVSGVTWNSGTGRLWPF